MAVVYLEGFDKYGPVAAGTSSYPHIADLLTAGEWTSGGNSCGITSPLSSTGYALVMATSLFKTLVGNYAQLIFGYRMNSTLTGTATVFGFYDNSNAQCWVVVESLTGRVSIYTGTSTLLATTAGPAVTAGVTHYIEADVTFGVSANYRVYVDGVLVLSGTGATKTTANNYANVILLGGNQTIFDDLYLFDGTGTTNNAPLRNSPRIETTFPISDAQTQFTNATSLIGSVHTGVSQTAVSANNLILVGPYISGTNVTLNSIGFFPLTTSVSAKYKAVIYANGSSTPVGQALIATGTEVVGMVSGSTAVLPFGSPPSLVAGTYYWIGFITDTNTSLQSLNGNPNTGLFASNTYGSGAPGTCPAMTSTTSIACWGNCTGSATNWVSEAVNGPPGDLSYMFQSTVGTEDLYGMTPLSVNPSAIYAVSAKGFAKRSDNGARTMNMQVKSGAVDSSGTITNTTPGTSYTWVPSYFETNPNTGAAWTKATLDAASTGPKIAS